MVTLPHRADPASCSRLGGALRSSAGVLAEHAAALTPGSSVGELAGDVTQCLDEVGAALQVHAQELAESVAAVQRLQARAEAAGLEVQGWKVVEPYGLARADDARRRLLALPELQQHLDRIAGRLGRSRAQLERVVQRHGAQLESVARQARAD